MVRKRILRKFDLAELNARDPELTGLDSHHKALRHPRRNCSRMQNDLEQSIAFAQP
jgi:hypothetical protein